MSKTEQDMKEKELRSSAELTEQEIQQEKELSHQDQEKELREQSTAEQDEQTFSAHTGKKPDYEHRTQKEIEAEEYQKEQEKKAMKEVLLGSDRTGYHGDYAADGKSLSYVKFVAGLHIFFAFICLVLRFHPNPMFQHVFENHNIALGLAVMAGTLALMISLNDAAVMAGTLIANIMAAMYLAAEGFDLLRDKDLALLAVFPAMLTALMALSAFIVGLRFFKNKNLHL